ncbi:MAG: tRNA pseudouridine(13) synthase TruD [Thermoplasmata archaeon]|nr:MAG: tRNA pseudouridine(13) synthase TruD [Thermoplasmata archaeon]
MKNLDVEKKVGIEVYLTKTPGINGKLRTNPRDFIVKEIPKHPCRGEYGVFTIAEITSENWETNLLVRELSKKLHISRKRIGFAGTKDKRAQTTQLMSFYRVPQDKLLQVKIKDVFIENIYYSDHPVRIGELLGNHFNIIIRDIDKRNDVEECVRDTVLTITQTGGFPNFYGIQRFGIIRPINHIVGKHIVHGDFEKAVMSYIANPITTEDKASYETRKKLQKTYNFQEALKSYQKQQSLVFEKAILNKLVNKPKDFVEALKELPTNLLTMFVYAYQSYIFNKILSERIKRKLPLNKAIIGDIVLPIRKNITDKKGIMVKKSNIDKINKQIEKGKALISGLIPGYNPVYAENEMGEIEHKIVEQEKLEHKDFIIPEIPHLSSSGSRRILLSPLRHIEWKIYDDNLNDGKLALNLKFNLQKGCYATSLLREFMKTKDIKNY